MRPEIFHCYKDSKGNYPCDYGYICDKCQEIGLPQTYSEIDYGNRADAEAVLGSRWDDMNYNHYMER